MIIAGFLVYLAFVGVLVISVLPVAVEVLRDASDSD